MADHDNFPPTQHLRFPDQQREFEAALLEVGLRKLPELQHAVTEAPSSLDPESKVDRFSVGSASRIALLVALSQLRDLVHQLSNFPWFSYDYPFDSVEEPSPVSFLAGIAANQKNKN